MKRFFQNFYLVLIMIFLYAPILIMMGLSFKDQRNACRVHVGAAHFLGIGGIENGVVVVVKAHAGELKPVQLRLYDLVEQFVLRRIGKSDAAGSVGDGKREFAENLAVDVVCKKQRILLLAFQHGAVHGAADEEREDDAGNENQHQRDIGEEFCQVERQFVVRAVLTCVIHNDTFEKDCGAAETPVKRAFPGLRGPAGETRTLSFTRKPFLPSGSDSTRGGAGAFHAGGNVMHGGRGCRSA